MSAAGAPSGRAGSERHYLVPDEPTSGVEADRVPAHRALRPVSPVHAPSVPTGGRLIHPRLVGMNRDKTSADEHEQDDELTDPADIQPTDHDHDIAHRAAMHD